MQSIKRKRAVEERRKGDTKPSPSSFDQLFDSDWGVFVIKYDKSKGKLVGKTACCWHSKVD